MASFTGLPPKIPAASIAVHAKKQKAKNSQHSTASKKDENSGMRISPQLKKKPNSSSSSKTSVESSSSETTITDPAPISAFINQVAELVRLVDSRDIVELELKQQGCEVVIRKKFMKNMELGVLSDMPDIQKKACLKLLKQQVVHRDNLLSSYKEMVVTVINMVNTSMSLRCFLKGETNSPLIKFSSSSNDTNDNGDGGGIPVFIFWSISSFEKLAWELVQMFRLELNLKRLLVIEFLSLRSKEDSIIERLCWSDEIYQGEFDDLSRCNLDCRDASESASIKLDGFISENSNHPNSELDSDVLQVYLTAWLTDVNIDKQRVEDIFCEVGEEMHVNFVS
ncbi:hypothetical protein SSX86_000166 [Deinandra increscens subsp. villosa]|uniref:Uncharacterized protein n=1 Tax=Deinandra increscens subsp. villosa TaxID=3103831 RepID=A0AAP0E0D1_9ASTR